MSRTRIETPNGTHIFDRQVIVSASGAQVELHNDHRGHRIDLVALEEGQTVSCFLEREGTFDEAPVVVFERRSEGVAHISARGERVLGNDKLHWGPMKAFSRFTLDIVQSGEVRESWGCDTRSECGTTATNRIADNMSISRWQAPYEAVVREIETLPLPTPAPSGP